MRQASLGVGGAGKPATSQSVEARRATALHSRLRQNLKIRPKKDY